MPSLALTSARAALVFPRRAAEARFAPPPLIGAGRGIGTATAPLTSYANPGGSGNRTAGGDGTIAISSNIVWDQGATVNLINGVAASNATDAVDEPGVGSTSVAGAVIDFYFQDLKKFCDEITLEKDTAGSSGTWQFLTSNDGANFALGGTIAWTGTITSYPIAMPFSGAKLFRLLGISGTWSNAWFREVTFKIANGNPS
jgi:hypothetical protein